MDNSFRPAGMHPFPAVPPRKQKWYQGKPVFSAVVLAGILLGCLFCDFFIPKDPVYMDLYQVSLPPGREFLFGTDTMGRDIFSMIWYGGRISLCIGFLSAAVSAAIAIILGAVSGMAPGWLDALIMRLTEIFLSIPSLLLVLLFQAFLGEANILTISLCIGVTGWAGIAKVVRTEVRKLRSSEYVIASRCMGGGFFHILFRHLIPNFLSSIMFMVVMNIRSAMAAESTLSFMGMGLPLEVISWGSMLSLSEKALSSGSWWMILIPGIFLIATLLSLTDIGNFLRKNINRTESSL